MYLGTESVVISTIANFVDAKARPVKPGVSILLMVRRSCDSVSSTLFFGLEYLRLKQYLSYKVFLEQGFSEN